MRLQVSLRGRRAGGIPRLVHGGERLNDGSDDGHSTRGETGAASREPHRTTPRSRHSTIVRPTRCSGRECSSRIDSNGPPGRQSIPSVGGRSRRSARGGAAGLGSNQNAIVRSGAPRRGRRSSSTRQRIGERVPAPFHAPRPRVMSAPSALEIRLSNEPRRVTRFPNESFSPSCSRAGVDELSNAHSRALPPRLATPQRVN